LNPKASSVKLKNISTVAMDHHTKFFIPHLLSIFPLLYFLYLSRNAGCCCQLAKSDYNFSQKIIFFRSLFKKERKMDFFDGHIGFSFHWGSEMASFIPLHPSTSSLEGYEINETFHQMPFVIIVIIIIRCARKMVNTP
jgi:hypothetical protein